MKSNKFVSIGMFFAVLAFALKVASSNNLPTCAGDERDECRVTFCQSQTAGGATKCGAGASTKIFLYGGAANAVADYKTKCGTVYTGTNIQDCIHNPQSTMKDCGGYCGDMMNCNLPSNGQ